MTKAPIKKGKRYNCPYCDYRGYRDELIEHVEDDHEDMIPKGYSSSRVVYNHINKKDHGTCMICKKETKWDENKQRYDTLCGNPKCRKEYVQIVRSRMTKKYGTYNLLTDPEFQKKMLEGRSISGKYKFEDGGSIGYVGSYEKKFLEFMDKFLHIKSYDIISPGPNIPYMYKGKEHIWITDFLYEPYNLVFDIKDGGDNPNTRDMKEYREKQIAKEKAISEYGDYNYIRLTDNKFEQLISIFMELKEKEDKKPIIRINESVLNEEYVQELGFLETAFTVYLMAFAGYVGYLNIKEYIDKKVEDVAFRYEVSDQPIKKIPKYGQVKVKDALAYYAYYSLKIRKSEKGTLLYTSNNKSNLNKHVYLYKFNKNKLVLVEEGKFSDICKNNKVNIKSLDESKLNGREEAYKLAVDIIKKEINKYPDLKKHASIGEDDQEYYNNYINGIDDEISVLRCDLWDVVPNARSDEGDKAALQKVWNPSDAMIKIINDKLPKDFKVEHGGDWDDLMIILTHKVSIKESYIKEENTEFINHLTAYHLEPKIGNKKPYAGGWDEELYSKDIESAINNDIKYNPYIKDKTEVKAYVFTAGKNLKAIYLGIIDIPDKNNPSNWEWEEKALLNDDSYDYLKKNPLSESLIEESKIVKPEKCTKCGSTDIGVYLHGEPVFKCNQCKQFLGVVPFPDKKKSKKESTIEEFNTLNEYTIIGEFVNNLEEAMSSKERNELKDDEFGIPDLRKYPLHDKKHVEQAIKMFNHVDKKYEAELAENLLDAMEKYRISTDVVGDKNRLKKYIKEETVYEGLVWNDNTPEDIKKLKEDIKEEIKTDTDLDDILDTVKDSIKNKDFSGDEKKVIYKILRKLGLNIHGYTIMTTSYGSVEISNTHTVIVTYKNYILTIKFMGAKGKIVLTSVIPNYDKKCKIPKNVAFDFISMLSPDVDQVKCTKHSIKISALSDAIDSGYSRISHKYSNKYKVKKNFGGLSITLSSLRSVRESSLLNGTMHRQDFNPNSVYIVNYLKKNTFESDIAICKDKMSSIFVCKDGKPIHMSLTDFKEMVSECKVYEFIGDTSFEDIIKNSHNSLDFYKNIVCDESVTIDKLESDYRFNKVSSYIDELNSIEECIINSAPKTSIINEVYCPVIPLINLNLNESSVHYFRDINGVFAQNKDTLQRSASYKTVDEIPKTTINLLKNI